MPDSLPPPAAITAETRTIEPRARLRGALHVPGDKSISHRAAMLAGLAEGRSEIHGFLQSEDCLNTLKAMQALGARISCSSDRFLVTGCAGRFAPPDEVLDMGNSGTGIRLLAGLLAGQPFESVLTGDASLRSRPMGRIRVPLEQMGAHIALTGAKGCAPIRIRGGNLRGIVYPLPVASAQVKSCTLLAGLFAAGDTTVIEPEATRDHTERMLRAAGVPLVTEGLRVTIRGGAGAPCLRPRNWMVPGDFSSAAFWLVAAAARPGAELVVEGVGLNPRRTALLAVLRRMGADLRVEPDSGTGDGEPSGRIIIRGSYLRATTVGGAEIPNLIDELPILAVGAALAEGTTRVCDAAELRVKESDRIATIVAGLRACGVACEELPDGFVVRGGGNIAGGCTVDSYYDHRIAMAISVLASFADAPVTILQTECVATSYPRFWRDLEVLTA